MATLPEIKHSIRTSTAAYISAYFEEHETYPVDIGLIHGDFIAEELYEGFSWSDEINGFYEFSGGAPAAPLLFDRWISLTTTGDYQANWYYEWDGLQWNEISPKIGKPYWIKSQELHRYFNGDIWAQLAGVVGTTDHRELSNLNSAGYWHLTELEYDYFSGLSNLLGGKENVGVAAGLVVAHENTWDHDSFLTALPEHNHDSRYYTETETNSLLSGKQPLHANLTQISGLPATAGNFIVGNGTSFVGRALQNSDLPAIAITDTFVVASQAAMLALTAAERGDVAVRTDLNKSFILKGDIYSSLSDWTELLSPTDAVLSVDDRTGVVSLADRYNPIIAAGTTNQFLSWDKTMRAVDWSYIANKPSLFAPSVHTHHRLDGIPDIRNVNTAPSLYQNSLQLNFKTKTAIGLVADGAYATLLGINGWNDATGGYSNEIAFSNSGLYTRRGDKTEDVWGDWHRVLTTELLAGSGSALTASKSDHNHTAAGLPSNIVYTDSMQTITGAKTFTQNTTFGGNIIGSGTSIYIYPDDISTTKNKFTALGYPSTGIGASVQVYENNHPTQGGNLLLYAGDNGKIITSGGVIVLSVNASQIIETNENKQLVSVAKGTAYNKSFAGSGSATTVARSDHNHSGVYQPLLSLISEYAGMVSFNFGSTWMSFGNTSSGQTISTSGNLQLSPASGRGIIMNGWEDHSGAYTYNNVFLEYQGAGPIPTADYAAIRITYPSNHVYSLEAGMTMQRIVVINSTTSAVHEIEGQLVGPGKFCDFLYDGTKWYSEY